MIETLDFSADLGDIDLGGAVNYPLRAFDGVGYLLSRLCISREYLFWAGADRFSVDLCCEVCLLLRDASVSDRRVTNLPLSARGVAAAARGADFVVHHGVFGLGVDQRGFQAGVPEAAADGLRG
nr:hypothetical protein [Nocardia otitidiscaviarum]